jgi:hypothetical protein
MRTTSRFIKVAVSAGLVVATGAGVLGITSFASAQMSGPSSTTQVVEASASHLQSPLAVVATALGMTEAEVRIELEAGQSIAQVAKTKNVDLQVVIDALIAQHRAHIAEHVAERKLTQVQADEKLANLEARVTEMVNKAGLSVKGGPGGNGGHGGKLGHIKAASEEVAAVLNMTTTELAAQLREGKSLATIAEAQDVDINKVKDVLTAQFKARLDEEVTAGKHTQAEADEKLAKFESHLDGMVNRERPGGGKMGRGHGGGHGGGYGSGHKM